MHIISDTNLQVFVWPLFDHANKCRVCTLREISGSCGQNRGH